MLQADPLCLGRVEKFKTAGFNSSYKVTIREGDLLVEPRLLNLNATQPYLVFLFSCLPPFLAA